LSWPAVIISTLVSALTAGRPAPAVPQPLSATDSAALAAAEAAASTLRLFLISALRS
jgi:hypothetical protein